MFDADSKMYDIDEDLLYFRTKSEPKKDKIHFDKEDWHGD